MNGNQGIEREVVELVAKVIKVPAEKVNLDANLFTDLGVDSLLGIEIFAVLDKKYGISVPEDRLRDIHTVRNLIDLVKELKKL